MIDFSYTDEQKMIIDTVRKFVEKECPKQLMRELDEKDVFPRDIFKKIADLGLLGLSVEEKYGGAGRDTIGYLLVIEEMAKAHSALGFAVTLSFSYGGENISNNGNEAQKQVYLPKIAKGECLFALALTEPDAGSDLASLKSNAVEKGDKFIINGTKTLITDADVADYILTLVRTDKNLPKHKGLSFFIIDAKKEGITIRKIEKLGYKGSSICEVNLEDVEVSRVDILGGPGCINNGWGQLLKILDIEHLEMAANSLGVAQAAFNDTLQYAKEREQFGQPIGKFQVIGHMLAEMGTEIQAARLMMLYAAWLKDRGMPCGKEGAMAKYYASEVAKKVALNGMQIHGGYGYTMEYDVQRYVRDSLLLPIGGGTTQIQKNIISRHLGL